MNNRQLGILALVAAGMVVWAVVQAQLAGGRHVAPSGPAYLIQGLDPASIDSITVGQGKDTVTIKRQENQFVVANEQDYPADTKQINDLIAKVLDIKTAEIYTSNPKNQEDLEVTEAKARGVVKFFKPDGALLTGVIVGKSQESGPGAYVRLASSDDVYVAESAPWFRTRALDYVDQELVNVKREDVNSVTVTTPDGTYKLRSAKQGEEVTLEGMPADQKLKTSEAKSVLTALTSLRFDDVNKPADVKGLTFDHQYVCRLNNSTEYRLKLAQKGAKTYLQCEARYTDPTKVTINTNQVDSPEELKKKEAILLAQEGAQKFTLRTKGWVYEIPDWKAKYLMKKQSELYEEKPKPAAEPPAQPAEPKAEAPKPAPPAPVPAAPPAPSQPAPAVKTAEPNQPAPAVQPAQPLPPAQPAATVEPNKPA
jgi:hypothetical protein